MKIGFSVLSHQKPGPMLSALLKQLNEYPDSEVAIHHDFFQAEFDEKVVEGLKFTLVKDYIRTYWSHVNNIHAILETFKVLVNKDCDWFITLSANCYPIKSPDYIIDFLSKTSFDGFIERNNVLTDHFDFYKYFRKGFETKYLFKVPMLTRKGKFKYKAIRAKRNLNEIYLNKNFAPYHGSDWFMINKKVMLYLLSKEKQIKDIVSFLADVNKGHDINVCPPEVVFQTILGNSSDFNLNNDNFRFIDWTGSTDWHPNTLTIKDLPAMKKSEGLFARKFSWDKSKDLLHAIDQELLSK